jgi:hypothetical protein
MKNVESVINGFLGWGKTRLVAIFPQTLFGLLSLIIPKIFTMKGGEGGVSASHPRVETLSRRLVHLNLTLHFYSPGG